MNLAGRRPVHRRTGRRDRQRRDAGDNPFAGQQGGTMEAAGGRFLRIPHGHLGERGSVVAVASAGNILALNRYDEYGIPAASNLGRFQYTGQAWLPELGMYHYKARLYSPTLGRFLQTDPIGYADGMNVYAYVGNDPINGVDPSGEIGIFGLFLAGVASLAKAAPPIVVTAAKTAAPTLGAKLATAAAGAAAVTAPLAISVSPSVSNLCKVGRCPTDGTVDGNLGDSMITITAKRSISNLKAAWFGSTFLGLFCSLPTIGISFSGRAYARI